MNKKNYNKLYNKTAEDLTFKDKVYISRVVKMPKLKLKLLTVSLIAPLIIGILFSFMAFFGDIIGKVFAIVFTTTAAVASTSAYLEEVKRRLKGLNLTRKDVKELKKSGRLEQLKEIVQDFDLSSFSKIRHIDEEIAHYENEKEEIQHYIDKSETEKKNLNQKLIEKYNLTEDEVSDLIETYDYQDQQDDDEIDYEQNSNNL